MLLKDKIALVTGGSRRIGRGIAVKLAESGCKVVINYRQNDSAAADTRKSHSADCIEKIMESMGRVFLVHPRIDIPASDFIEIG